MMRMLALFSSTQYGPMIVRTQYHLNSIFFQLVLFVIQHTLYHSFLSLKNIIKDSW